MKKEHRCSDIESMIPNFIEHKLEHKDLILFLSHLDNCENCKEELVIQYLVTEGIAHLEAGEAFDLKKELDMVIESARLQVKHHQFVSCIRFTMEIIGILAIIVVVVFLLA